MATQKRNLLAFIKTRQFVADLRTIEQLVPYLGDVSNAIPGFIYEPDSRFPPYLKIVGGTFDADDVGRSHDLAEMEKRLFDWTRV